MTAVRLRGAKRNTYKLQVSASWYAMPHDRANSMQELACSLQKDVCVVNICALQSSHQRTAAVKRWQHQYPCRFQATCSEAYEEAEGSMTCRCDGPKQPDLSCDHTSSAMTAMRCLLNPAAALRVGPLPAARPDVARQTLASFCSVVSTTCAARYTSWSGHYKV